MTQTNSRKRRNSEDIEYETTCISPPTFEVPTASQREQHVRNPPHFEQWNVNDVASFFLLGDLINMHLFPKVSN